MQSQEIAKDILLKLIEKDMLSYEGHPDANNAVDLACEAYKQIYKAVTNN